MLSNCKSQVWQLDNEGKGMLREVKRFFHAGEGATSIEYALIASLISILIIAGATLLGGNLQVIYGDIANMVQ